MLKFLKIDLPEIKPGGNWENSYEFVLYQAHLVVS